LWLSSTLGEIRAIKGFSSLHRPSPPFSKYPINVTTTSVLSARKARSRIAHDGGLHFLPELRIDGLCGGDREWVGIVGPSWVLVAARYNSRSARAWMGLSGYAQCIRV
jgi:hypothetical protein